MELREQFEKLHPAPEFLRRTPTHYAVMGNCYEYEACRMYNSLWQGFQSGHAAGLEAAAKFLDEWNTAIGDDLAKSIRAMKEPK